MPRVLSCFVRPCLAFALLFATAAGCRPKDSLDADQDLPPGKVQALMQADKTISEGERLTQEGVRLRDEGKTEEGEKMIREGETKKAQGQQMMDRAKMMK
jgi:hypothetical protein